MSSPLPKSHSPQVSRISGLVGSIQLFPADQSSDRIDALEAKTAVCEEVLRAWSGELKEQLEAVEREVSELREEEETDRKKWRLLQGKAEETVERMEESIAATEYRLQSLRTVSAEFHLLRQSVSPDRRLEDFPAVQMDTAIAQTRAGIGNQREAMRRLEERIRRKMSGLGEEGKKAVKSLVQEREVREKETVRRVRTQLMQIVDEVAKERERRLQGQEAVSRLLEALRAKSVQLSRP